jgi:hypothetical protein
MNELIEALRSTKVELAFTKVDGTRRDMKCTLNADFIPTDKLPKNESTRKVSETSLAVFDLEKQEWRSFKTESVITWSTV